MRIQIQKLSVGSVLVMTLVICGVLAILLASSLSWISSRNKITRRSLAWNNAMPVLEAGIEEALTQLHDYSDNITANGWTAIQVNSNTVYQKRRDFTNDGTFCMVTISNSLKSAVIYSQGFVPAPYADGYISRTVRVAATNSPLFFAGIVTKEWIQMSGNKLVVDSYDPRDPNKSLNGAWYAPLRTDQGNVATISGLLDSFGVGNANIWGKIGTGPGGTFTVGAGGSVGDLAWHAGGNSGVESGFYRDDFNCSFPAILAPSNNIIQATGGKINGNSYQVIIKNDGDYSIQDLTGSVYIQPNVKATLSVYGTFKLSGSDALEFGSNAKLKLYAYSSDVSLGGKGVINQGGTSLSFQYYGMPSNQKLSFQGNAQFTGVIYAPDTDFSMGGGGGTPIDFSGASVTKTLKINGKFNLHYDESLGAGPQNGFVITSWAEL